MNGSTVFCRAAYFCKRMDLKQKNIENIISLWTEVSAPFNGNYNKEYYAYSYLPFSEWPNRLWSYRFTANVLDAAIQLITAEQKKLMIPYWDDDHDLFVSKGFQQKSQLVGMSLPLQGKLVYEKRLQLIRVETRAQCHQWSSAFQLAFNYFIHEDVIENAPHPVQYYIALHGNAVVGTAILYIHNGIAGIHGVGVLPTMRKMGFADEIMKALINMAIESNATHAVLQASKMGIGIYRRLGFQVRKVKKAAKQQQQQQRQMGKAC
jgi:N-acetylglutamate synthase-like GNAT family acetyltransferase